LGRLMAIHSQKPHEIKRISMAPQSFDLAR
jgi:hypothetical protein